VSSCPSCGADIAESFCPRCGEKRREPGDLTLRSFLAHAIESFTSVDGRILGTVRLVLFRPGALAADFVRGARARHARPLQLFLLANLVYFLAQPWTHSHGLVPPLVSQAHGQSYSRAIVRPLLGRLVDADGVVDATYARAFDARSDQLSRSLVVLLVPLLGAAFALLHAGRRRHTVEHLTLALECTTWLLLVVWIATAALLHVVLTHVLHPRIGFDSATAIVVLPMTTAWFAFAFRRFYGTSLAGAWSRAALATVLLVVAVNVYRLALFLVTFAAVRPDDT
jgi:hypothetical protein